MSNESVAKEGERAPSHASWPDACDSRAYHPWRSCGQFANPLVRGALETTSRDRRSRGTVPRPGAAFPAYREAPDALFLRQFEPETRAMVAVLPDGRLTVDEQGKGYFRFPDWKLV